MSIRFVALRRQLLQVAAAATLIAAVPAVSLADYHTLTARERYEESVAQYERDRSIAELPASLYGSTDNGIYFNEDGSASMGDFYLSPGGPAISVDNPAYHTLDPKAELPPPLYGSLNNGGSFINPDGSVSQGAFYFHPDGYAIPTDQPSYSLGY